MAVELAGLDAGVARVSLVQTLQGAVSKAFAAIGDVALTVTVRRPGVVDYDPAAGAPVKSPVEITGLEAAWGKWSAQDRDVGRVDEKDVRLYIKPRDDLPGIETDNEIDAGGHTYVVKHVDYVRGGAAVLLYDCRCGA